LDKIGPPYYEVEYVETSHEDEKMMHALPFSEVIQILKAPTQEEVNTISYFHFQDFDDDLFYDLESEEVLEEPLDFLIPSCYDKGDDFVDNIDDFIHVGKHKWDVIRYDGDLIYGIEGHFQELSLQLSYKVTTNFDIWKQGDDVLADVFQAPQGDLALCSYDGFWLHLEDCGFYSFDHLDLFYEENCQPLLCSNFDKGEVVSFLKQDTCDKVVHLPLISLPCYLTKGAFGKYVPCFEFYLRQSLVLKFKGR
jgi:hypothetical protein